MTINDIAFLSAIRSNIGQPRLTFLISDIHTYVSRELQTIVSLIKRGETLRLCQVNQTIHQDISELLEGLGLKPIWTGGATINRYNDIVQEVAGIKKIVSQSHDFGVSNKYKSLIDLLEDSVETIDSLINNYKTYINNQDNTGIRKPFSDIYEVLLETRKSLSKIKTRLVRVCTNNSIGTLLSILDPDYFRNRIINELQSINVQGGGYLVCHTQCGGGTNIDISINRYNKIKGLAKSKVISEIILFIINNFKTLDKNIQLPRVSIMDIYDSLDSLNSVYRVIINQQRQVTNQGLIDSVMAKARSLSRDISLNQRMYIGIPEINDLVEKPTIKTFFIGIQYFIKAQILIFLINKYGPKAISFSVSIDEVANELWQHIVTHGKKTSSPEELNTIFAYYGLSYSDICGLRQISNSHRKYYAPSLIDEMLSLIFEKIRISSKATRKKQLVVSKLLTGLRYVTKK